VRDVSRSTPARSRAPSADEAVVFGVLRDLQGGYMLPLGIAAGVQVAAPLLVLVYRVR